MNQTLLIALESDFLRSTGKIYTVVIGILILFTGIAIYLKKLDNKISKLENQIEDDHKAS